MLKRAWLFGFLGILVLSLAACGPAPEPTVVEDEPPPPPPEPPPPVHELTEAAITEEMPDFTSRNVSILGVKVGDITRNVEANLGELDNTRTTEEEYVTAYQDGGIVVYTFKLTGRATRIEVTQLMADEIADPQLQRLLRTGNLDLMREILGQEAAMEELPDENAVAYVYPNRGIRFLRYTINGQRIHAIRLGQIDDSNT